MFEFYIRYILYWKKVNLKKVVMMEKYNILGICKKREKIVWEFLRSIERLVYLVVFYN